MECSASTGGKGVVVSIRTPRPVKPSETIDIVFTRPVKLTLSADVAATLGGMALIEDTRTHDKSKAIATTANSFFAKVSVLRCYMAMALVPCAHAWHVPCDASCLSS